MTRKRRAWRLLGITGVSLSLFFGAWAVDTVGAQETSTPSNSGVMVDINVPAKPDTPPALRLGPNQTVAISLSSDKRALGTGTTDVNGALALKIPLPADLKSGTYTIEISGASAAGTPLSVTHQIDVTSTGLGATTLPHNASEPPSSTTILLAALSLAFVAANLVLIQRRLRRQTAKTALSNDQDVHLRASDIHLS